MTQPDPGDGFFVAHDEETGRPYLGLKVSYPGCSLMLYMAGQDTARQLLSTVQRAVNGLMAAKPKLVAVKGGSDGIRVPGQ